MKRFFITFILSTLLVCGYGQTVVQLKGDTIRSLKTGEVRIDTLVSSIQTYLDLNYTFLNNLVGIPSLSVANLYASPSTSRIYFGATPLIGTDPLLSGPGAYRFVRPNVYSLQLGIYRLELQNFPPLQYRMYKADSLVFNDFGGKVRVKDTLFMRDYNLPPILDTIATEDYRVFVLPNTSKTIRLSPLSLNYVQDIRRVGDVVQQKIQGVYSDRFSLTGITVPGTTGNVQFRGSNGSLSSRSIFTYDSTLGNLGIGTPTPTARLHGVGSSFLFQGEGSTSGGIFRIVPGVANSSDVEWGTGTLRFNGTGGQSLNLQAPFLTLNGSFGIGHGDLRLNTSGGTAMFISGSNNGRRANIGSSEAVSSAQLQVDANNRGFLPPRLTAAQRVAIPGPAAGLFLYDTDSSRLFGFNGTSWKGIRYTDEGGSGGGITYTAGVGIKALGPNSLQTGVVRLADTLSSYHNMRMLGGGAALLIDHDGLWDATGGSLFYIGKNFALLSAAPNVGEGGAEVRTHPDKLRLSYSVGNGETAGFSAMEFKKDTVHLLSAFSGSEPQYKPKTTSIAKYKVLLVDSTTGALVLTPPTTLGGSGVFSVGTFSGTGNAKGASISGSTITMHPATATEPGMVSIGAQEFAGQKTFTDILRTREINTNAIVPSVYFRDGFSGGDRMGIGRNGGQGSMQFFTYGNYRWYGGGDFNNSATDWMTLSSTGLTLGVDLNVNSVLRTFNAASNTAGASIYLRDFTGAGNQIGIGRGLADVQFFGINDYGFRWYGGGQFNNGAANWMYLDQKGLAVGGGTNPASAILTATSTDKGFLPPRMTATQAEAILDPAEGLLIYSTNGTGTTITSKGWWGYDGTTWVKL